MVRQAHGDKGRHYSVTSIGNGAIHVAIWIACGLVWLYVAGVIWKSLLGE